MFFVLLNLLVDVLQTLFDPRIQRSMNRAPPHRSDRH